MSNVHLTIDNNIATIRLDHPTRLNCLTQSMFVAFNQHLDRLENDADVRALIITSQGTRAFCSGADIADWKDMPPAEFARLWVRDGHRLFNRIAALHVPTLAVIKGYALGGGLELATACDVRIAAPDAMLALPETSIGIVPGWSGTQRLTRLLPEPIIRAMILWGEKIDAQRAYALGFVLAIADDPEAEALKRADMLAEKLSPRAVEIGKRMINAAVGEDRDMAIDALGSQAIAGTPDRQEGVASFMEKRKANW